jgi:hypothetical protein
MKYWELKEDIMDIERVKKIITDKKSVKILIGCILILGAIFYLKIFFTKGAYFDGVFLKKESIEGEKHYIGKSVNGDIHIIVKELESEKGNIDVIYKFPNDIVKSYSVSFKESSKGHKRIETTVKNEMGNVIFEGTYQLEHNILFDKYGKLLIKKLIAFDMETSYSENRYTANYDISLTNILEFAYSNNDTIWGNGQYLAIAIILGIILIIDISNPLFFFTLKHSLSVSDPEPTDLYIAIQRISWVIYPIIIVMCLIAAI